MVNDGLNTIEKIVNWYLEGVSGVLIEVLEYQDLISQYERLICSQKSLHLKTLHVFAFTIFHHIILK